MFPFKDTILLRGMRTSSQVDNVRVSTKGTKRSLDKLKSVIGTKNLRHSRILSDNLRDEMGDYSDNLKAVPVKVDPTYTSVVDKSKIILINCVVMPLFGLNQ